MGKFPTVLKKLVTWFNHRKRVLPWRDDPSVYRVWVSEIMLQQTQVATVVPYFERFMSHFPTVKKLAAASSEEVMLQWAGLGYYSRARNLHRAAQLIAKIGFPLDREGWLEMPGVGAYTAGAVVSIAYDAPEPILDGNVERVLSRVRRVSRGRGDVAYKERLWRLARIFVVRAHQLKLRPSLLNQALMELGATTCTPRKPKCESCPLQSLCRAYEASDMEAYPPRKKAKEWIQVREHLHCVVRLGRVPSVLLGKGVAGKWRSDLWDVLESPVGTGVCLGQVETRHVVTRHKIRRETQIWKTSAKAMSVHDSGTSGVELRWVPLDDPGVPLGSAAKKTLESVRSFLEVGPAS